ncbi:MAG: glycosyltransferase family 39 protein [Acidobacteriaceae bacterium]
MTHENEERVLQISRKTFKAADPHSARAGFDPWHVEFVIYAVGLLTAISLWLFAISSPLWLDETGSYWVIAKGLRQIAARQGSLADPLYSYILWFVTRVTGTSEIGMRVPSVLAMLGAAYVLYRCARHLFDREMALVATLLFCLNPIVISESIDARPYAFEILATNLAILVLLRLRKSDSLWLAGLFGLLSALIVYFHFLGAAVLPGLLAGFIVWKRREGKIFWQQLGVGLAACGAAFLPLIPDLRALFHHPGTHVFEKSPSPVLLLWIFLPGLLPFVGAVVAGLLMAAVTVRTKPQVSVDRRDILLCFFLALFPVGLLYGISVGTPIHMFAFRHELTAVAGISLCWALGLERLGGRAVRMAFSIVLVGATATLYLASPGARQHDYSWKGAIAAAERSAAPDDAPVLVCSDYPEANFVPMPMHSAKESRYFSQLAYYKLSVPVVPLPRALNAEAKQVGGEFLRQAVPKHERFLAMGYKHSYKTLDWLEQTAAPAYRVKALGVYDGVKVLEFEPKSPGA